MDNLVNANQEFQADLKRINNNQPPDDIEEVLKHPKGQSYRFVDPDLLPESEKIPLPDSSSLAHETSYPADVLQIAWNLSKEAEEFLESPAAFIATEIFNKAWGNPSKITKIKNYFLFFDTEMIPRIVDDKTYEVGKALRNLFTVIKENPNIFPLLNKFLEVDSLIDRFQEALQSRIHIYEAHQPEAIKKTQEALSKPLKTIKTLEEKTDNLKKLFEEVGAFVNSQLKFSDSTEHIEKKISEIKKLSEEIKGLNENLQAFKEQEIMVSSFLFSLSRKTHGLATKSDELQKNWLNLYNNDPAYINVSDFLNQKQQAFQPFYEELQFFYELYMPHLENRLSDLKKLKNYNETLQSFKKENTQPINIQLPDILMRDKNYTNEQDLIQSIEDLRNHKKNLQSQPLTPLPKVPDDVVNAAPFHALQQDELKKRQKNIQNQMDVVSEKIDSLLQRTKKGREDLLKNSGRLVTIYYTEMSRLKNKLEFLKKNSLPPVNEAQKRQVLEHAKERKKQLITIIEKLDAFTVANINKSTSYILTEIIDKDELKTLIDGTKAINELIDTLYEHEEKAKEWRGFNRYNAINQITHTLIQWLLPPVFTANGEIITANALSIDMESLLDAIAEKRAQLQQELAVDVTATSAEVPFKNEHSLFALQKKYKKIIAAPQIERKKAIDEAEENYETSKKNHADAMQQYKVLQFEFMLKDISEQLKRFETFKTDLEALEAIQALEKIEADKQWIKQYENIFEYKKHPAIPSCRELFNALKQTDDLSKLDAFFKQYNELSTKHNDLFESFKSLEEYFMANPQQKLEEISDPATKLKQLRIEMNEKLTAAGLLQEPLYAQQAMELYLGVMNFFANIYKDKSADVEDLKKEVRAQYDKAQNQVERYKERAAIKSARDDQEKKLNESVAEIDTIIKQCKTKIQSTRGGKTNRTAHQLLTKLEQYKDVFAESAKRDLAESARIFMTSVTDAINETKPQLEKQLGLGNYLINLLKKLANAVTKACSKAVTCGYSSHQGFFTLKRSESVKAVEKMEEDLLNLPLNNN